eukprot:m.28266 g.28266  ORF g.28266 m.28266 type:complete len:350 (+) comp9072_c1_seq1:903-1952(+)
MAAARRAQYVSTSTADDVEVDRPARQRLLSCPVIRESLVREKEDIMVRTHVLKREGHAVLLKSVINFRDISSFNHTIRPGIIFRSARPKVACTYDAEYLIKRLGIKTIIDLREEDEAGEDDDKGNMGIFKPCSIETALKDDISPLLLRIPLARRSSYARTVVARATVREVLHMGARRAMGLFSAAHHAESVAVGKRIIDRDGLLGMNKMILKHSPKEILDILKLCATPQRHPILIHCSHGKDRTGLASALILAAVGVDVKDIVSDYVASDTLGGVELCTKEVSDKHQGVLRPEEWGSAQVELILDTFKHIDDTYGSFEKFLSDQVKLTHSWHHRLNEALLRTDFGDDVA